MKREMTLTIVDQEYKTIGSIVRSFDNEQASGNFAVCRVRVAGERFNRISCERDVLVYPSHPAESKTGTRFYDACRVALEAQDNRLYGAYTRACKRENVEPHTYHMWHVHNRPTGPI